MDKQYFIELLNKYLEGRTSAKENEVLFSYYEQFEEDRGFKVPDPLNKQELRQEINDKIWQNIYEQEQQKRRSISRYNLLLKLSVAAALIVICLTTVLYVTKSTPQQTASVNLVNKQRENHLVHLQDGSSVILGAGSKLRFPNSFDGLDKREVFLEGEAFFDISHNPAKRFIVHTGKIEVTVLGTGFNVNAQPGNGFITVTVKRGKVKINDSNKVLGFITKGQQMVYDKQKEVSTQSNVSSNSNLVWERQDISLEDVTVGEAAKILEDKFDVTISFRDPEISTERFTTVFMQHESLDDVLKSVCEFNHASYDYNRKTSTIIISKIKPN